jgi:ubiquinone/menaquinone biosynthesis C-methylase UbiE
MQNIYDDANFFAGYSELRRAESGLNAAVEQPALGSLLPSSMLGMSVLDLGCGFGDFARLARDRGAEQVTAIDISSRMLAAARLATSDAHVHYVQSPIETFDMGANAFDLVVSSLALHYVESYRFVVEKVARALRPGGSFVFSVEHPIATAYGTYEWHQDDTGAKLYWKLDRYREESRRESTWFVGGVIKYHRTVETYVNALLDAGFTLRRLSEPEATAEAMNVRPDLVETRRRPAFLVLTAVVQEA